MNTLEGIIEDVEKSDLVSKKVIDKVIELIGQERWQELNDEEGDTITTTGELWITLNGIPDLEKEIKKIKSQYDYAFNQLRESREIVCLMLSQYKNKKEIDYSTKERGEKLLKQGVYKYD